MNRQGKVSQCMYSAAIQETASVDGHRTGSEGGLLAQCLSTPKWGVSPHTIITGRHVDYNKHCKYEFGQYVQVHHQHDNTMLPQTTGALALRPTGNAQGNFYFFSLTTGRVVNRVHATPLPMPDNVIKRVETLACRQQANPGLVFGDREQQPINDLDDYYYDEADDADYNTDDDEQDDSEFDEDYEYGSEDDDEEYNEDIEEENCWQAVVNVAVPEPAIPEADEPNTGDPDQVHNDQHMNEEPEENHDIPMENPHLQEETVESTGVEDDQDMASDTNAVVTPGVGNDPTEPDIGTESKTVGGYGLQQNRAHTYSHLKTQASSQEWGKHMQQLVQQGKSTNLQQRYR